MPQNNNYWRQLKIPKLEFSSAAHFMEVTKTTQSTIAHLRKDFLRENDIQFILDKAYLYGWADSYVFSDNENLVGYGADKDGRKKCTR